MSKKTIPVCGCVTPDPAEDFPIPLCHGCGRLILDGPSKRVEVRVRPVQVTEECVACGCPGECACPCDGCRARQTLATRGT